MAKKVLKFGGTSVGSIERIQLVANIIKKEHLAGNNVVVVVSAMAGKTNELIKFSNTILLAFCSNVCTSIFKNINLILICFYIFK